MASKPSGKQKKGVYKTADPHGEGEVVSGQVRLCSVTGDIFPPEDAKERATLGLQGQTAKNAYLARILHPVLASTLPCERSVQQASSGNEDPLLDACRYVIGSWFSCPAHRFVK